jgi:hypothetical protein
MQTTCGNSGTLLGADGVMPPRWGWGFAGDVACYRDVAPLALSHPEGNGEFAGRVL